MTRALKFLVWSEALTIRGWVSGMLIRLVCWGINIALIAWAVLNPQNPAYNPQERAALDQQAAVLRQTGQLEAARWRELLQSASVECHYRAKSPTRFLVSAALPDRYIVPNSGEIRWYLKFPVNLSPTLFGPPELEVGIVSLQAFYGMVKIEEFKACTTGQATAARRILAL